MSVDTGVDKEDAAQMPNGILLCHKKEWRHAICSNMDGIETIILSEVSQRKTNVWYHFYVDSKKKKKEFIYKMKIESQM